MYEWHQDAELREGGAAFRPSKIAPNETGKVLCKRSRGVGTSLLLKKGLTYLAHMDFRVGGSYGRGKKEIRMEKGLGTGKAGREGT